MKRLLPVSPPPRRLGWPLALGLLLGSAALSACGGDTCQGLACGTLPDLGPLEDGGGGGVDDAATSDESNVGPADGQTADGDARAPMGAPCESSPQCLSGYCFKPPQGDRFCTSKCFGPCPQGFVCEPLGATRVCVVDTACQPDCEDRACGDDGCGGSCGDCPQGLECVSGGLCAVPKAPLGAPCTTGAACSSGACASLSPGAPPVCAQPCALLCPPGMRCDHTLPAPGEDGEADPTKGLCVPSGCEPDCQDKVCGGDGCGGSCGACPNGGVCEQNQCRPLACEDIPETGCCVGEVLMVCASSGISQVDCGLQPHCGWNPNFASYLCFSDDDSEPTGNIPRTCGVDPAGGGMSCAQWALCAAGCPPGDMWCATACQEKTVASARPLVQAIAACDAENACALAEPCMEAHCASSWAECVATASPGDRR